MSLLFFIDESGQDQRESPNEVLAGLSIEDAVLWDFVKAIHKAELECFGVRYSSGDRELKGKKLLNKKVYRLAGQLPPIDEDERRLLAKDCLEAGATANQRQITALAQSKLAFVEKVLKICKDFRARAFAAITAREALRPPADGFLRKDYAYLFQRFYYLLEDTGVGVLGIIVFDELDKSRSHVLVDQMSEYFLGTNVGRQRSARIIPEPFFVHSDLTTAIQAVDLIAYIVAWGVQILHMRKPARPELANLAELVYQLRYRTFRGAYEVWSFTYLTDLRPAQQKK